MTQFCATYCSGFVNRVAKCLTKSVSDALVNEPDDDETPRKKIRFENNPSKRVKTHHNPDGNLETEPPLESSMPSSAADPNPARSLPDGVSASDREPHCPNNGVMPFSQHYKWHLEWETLR